MSTSNIINAQLAASTAANGHAPPSAPPRITLVTTDRPRSRRYAEAAAHAADATLHGAFERFDCLIVDELIDAAFIERCFMPCFRELFESGQHQFMPFEQKRVRDNIPTPAAQRAICQRIRYLGETRDAAASAQLKNHRSTTTMKNEHDQQESTPMDSDCVSTTSSADAAAPLSSPTTTTPLWFEMDNAIGGFVMAVRYPNTRSRLNEVAYEVQMRRAHEAGNYTKVICNTVSRARCLFYTNAANVFQFDRRTFTMLLINSYVLSVNQFITAPLAMRRAIDISARAIGSVSLSTRQQLSASAAPFVFERFFDVERIRFYANAIKLEEFARSAVYAHAVEQVHVVEDRRLEVALHLDEIAAERAQRAMDAIEAAEMDQYANDDALDELIQRAPPPPPPPPPPPIDEQSATVSDDGVDLEAFDDSISREAYRGGRRADDFDDDDDAIREAARKKLRSLGELMRAVGGDDALIEAAVEPAPLVVESSSAAQSYQRKQTRSLNSDIPSALSSMASGTRVKTVHGEPGFARTPFRVLEGVQHEFVDRLRSHERAASRIDSRTVSDIAGTPYVVLQDAPRRLVRRFQLLVSVLLRLVEHYYRFAMDLFNSLDFFHLYALCEFEMNDRPPWLYEQAGGKRAGISKNTLAALEAFIAANQRCAEARQPPIALAGITIDELQEMVELSVEAAEHGDAHEQTCMLFGPELMLHRVIDNFQTLSEMTPRQRRSRSTFHPCEIVDYAYAQSFIARHGLLTAPQRIDALNAAEPYDLITSRVLRFRDVAGKKNIPSPLALISTLRAYGARDGDNALLLWTPACLAPLPGEMLLLLRESAWRRLMCVYVPRTVIEHRALGDVCKRYKLMAPSIYAALHSADFTVVVEALATVQALFSRAPAALPAQWNAADRSSLKACRHAVRALKAAAHACINGIENVESFEKRCRLNAAILVCTLQADTLQREKRGYVQTDSAFAAVQVALAGGRCHVYIHAKAAAALLEDFKSLNASDPDVGDLCKLERLLRQQLSATNNSERGDTRRFDPDEPTKYECPCGQTVDLCDRLAGAVRMAKRKKLRDCLYKHEMLTIECCVCARVRLDHPSSTSDAMTSAQVAAAYKDELLGSSSSSSKYKKRKRRAIMVECMCEHCEERRVSASTMAPLGVYVPIYDPIASVRLDGEPHDGVLPPERIIELLATPARRKYVYALRIGSRPDRVCQIVMPRVRMEKSYGTKKKEKAAAAAAAASTTTTTTTTTTTSKTGKPSKHAKTTAYARTFVSDVIEDTKMFAMSREVRNASKTTGTTNGNNNNNNNKVEGDNTLLAFLVQMEVFTLLNHDELFESEDEGEALGAHLNVLSDNELSVLRSDEFTRDYNGLIDANAAGVLSFDFPVCEPVLVESNGFWRQTASSNPLLTMMERAHATLYAGRTPRPMLQMPPCFTELLFANWYSTNGSNEDPDGVQQNDAGGVDDVRRHREEKE